MNVTKIAYFVAHGFIMNRGTHASETTLWGNIKLYVYGRLLPDACFSNCVFNEVVIKYE